MVATPEDFIRVHNRDCLRCVRCGYEVTGVELFNARPYADLLFVHPCDIAGYPL